MPAELTRLPANTGIEQILEILDRDGGVIVERFLSTDRVDELLGELGLYIEQTAPIADDFSGHQTTRTGGLVGRSKVVRELLIDPVILGAANAFLKPHTDKVQVNLTQIIRLLPGQGAQELHRDRFIWGKYLPQQVEPQLNTIWALTEFTADNGATCVVPGSHRWDWDRAAQEHEITQAVMPRGSAMFYTGSVIHSGGENRSHVDRIALNLTYCNAWLRQEENQYLSCPPQIARALDPELRALLGYTMANYALGYYAPPRFVPGAPGTMPPEMAFTEDGALDLDAADLPEARLF